MYFLLLIISIIIQFDVYYYPLLFEGQGNFKHCFADSFKPFDKQFNVRSCFVLCLIVDNTF